MISREMLLLLAVLGGQPALAADFAVGLVGSDDPALPAPAARDEELNAGQIADMVRRAVDLAGGMKSAVADTARLVLIKPNISIADPSGGGIVTDARVVRGVALLVHEAAPRARILIAEGAGGWRSPNPTDRQGFAIPLVPSGPRWREEDGFAVGGYRQVAEELRGMDIDIDCFDLNFDRTGTLRVPGGGLAEDEYQIASTILEADAWINCPVAKTHGSKITCCMKNQFGVLPGLVYGWSKANGTESHPPMPHLPAVIDEVMVDLWLLTQMDLNVVDGIVGHQAGALQEGEPVRANLILAGRDPVAVDLVAARLMGFNPDDLEFADLAWQRGRGPGVYERVEVRGGKVEELARRFKKAGSAYESRGVWGEWRAQAGYGMGPRRWILSGPLAADHQFTADELARLAPVPGQGGWSEVVWFGHDRIDLDRHFDNPEHCAVYAFTHFVMPRADSVRFWAGSDEGLKVWIDGAQVYSHEGRRRHVMGQDRLPGYLEAGEHRLLVRAEQERGAFEFSFNICEPLDDPAYAGNRYPGLRYF